MKRLAVYAYSNPHGAWQPFAAYTLEKLRAAADRVLIVVSGALTPEARAQMGTDVLVRNGEPDTFAAWKTALDSLPPGSLDALDSLLLLDSTCYGPVTGSFAPLLETMAARQLDAWALTAYRPKRGYWYLIEPGTPAHLQPDFLHFGPAALRHPAFRAFWKNLRRTDTPKRARRHGAIALSTMLRKVGLRTGAFLDGTAFPDTPPGDLRTSYAIGLLQHGSPMLARTVFREPLSDLLTYSCGDLAPQALAYLRQHTAYPVDTILEDCATTIPPSRAQKVLQLFFPIGPTSTATTADPPPPVDASRLALITFVYFEDQVEDCLRYIQSMPAGSSLFIVSSRPDMLERYRARIDATRYPCVETRLQPNRGRSEGAYLTTCADVFDRFEYVCLIHDKKSGGARHPVHGALYFRHCYENLLSDEPFVRHVIHLFETHPRLGLLTPPQPLFSVFSDIFSRPWYVNEKPGRRHFETLPRPRIWDPHPCAPYGGMLWVRSRALRPALDLHLRYEDFPEEPIRTDGTLLHIIERLYPTYAQIAGFLTGVVMTGSYAHTTFANMMAIGQEQSRIRLKPFPGVTLPIRILNAIYFWCDRAGVLPPLERIGHLPLLRRFF